MHSTPPLDASNPDPYAVALSVAIRAIRGLTIRQARALIARGALPAARPAGSRSYFVRVEDLERLFAPVVRAPKAAKAGRETETARLERQLAEAGIAVSR